MANLDLEQIITTPGAADSAPAGAEKINSNFTKVEAAIPVNTSDLTNDSGFITNAVSNLANYYTKTQTYTKEEVNSLVGQLVQIQVVSSLPQSGQANTIYLVPSGGSKPDVYDEYVWVNSAWELIGNTEVDLSNYLQKTGDASDTTVTFVSEAGEPASGSKLSSLIGRIVKKLSDIVSGAITVGKATSADTATKATQDSDGNKISDTYLKRSGGTMTGTLVQKKSNCSIHTDVASLKIPASHTGWIALDCGLGNNIALVGYITLYRYYTGALSIQVSGYTYAEGIALTRDNWITPRYGIYGSWYGDMPQVAFVKDGTTGRRYIIIGGDDFAWNVYDYVSLDKVVLGSLGNTTTALPFSWSALSGTVASLGLVAATAGDISEGVEVQRARQDKDGNDIPSTYARKDEIPANLPPSGVASGDLKGLYPDPLVKQVTGEYTGSTTGYGGWNPPANFPKQKIQWRMMVASLKNKTLPFTNWMIMDPYPGADINYLSGIGVTREATPRAFIVSGVRGGTEASDWSDSLELATQTWVTSKLPSVYVDTVPSNPKDGDILITTTD